MKKAFNGRWFVGDDLRHPLGLFFGRIPQYVLKDLQVLGAYLVGAGKIGECLGGADGFELAAIAGPDAFLGKLAQYTFERFLGFLRPGQA